MCYNSKQDALLLRSAVVNTACQPITVTIEGCFFIGAQIDGVKTIVARSVVPIAVGLVRTAFGS